MNDQNEYDYRLPEWVKLVNSLLNRGANEERARCQYAAENRAGS
jgi:hypothetical protein